MPFRNGVEKVKDAETALQLISENAMEIANSIKEIAQEVGSGNAVHFASRMKSFAS